MWPNTNNFQNALRTSHVVLTSAIASYPGSADVPLGIISGTVSCTSAQGVRRQLDMTVANTGVEYQSLLPQGVWVTVTRGILFGNGATEMIPLGVFRVDDQAITYAGDDSVQITGVDRWSVVQDQQFETTTVPVPGNSIVEEITHLLVQVGASVRLLSSRDGTVRPGTTYTASREDAIYSLAGVLSLDVAFAADGVAEIRDLPTVASVPVWSVNSGVNGVLVTANRQRTRSASYNVLIVTDTNTSGTTPFAQVSVADTDTTSPTYVGGPFGRRPRFYSNDLVLTSADALLAAQSQLAQSTGLHSQVTLTAASNPALDVLDSVTVTFPPLRGITTTTEKHLIDDLSLDLQTSVQSMTTRAIGTADSPTDGSVRSWADVFSEASTWQQLDAWYGTWEDLLLADRLPSAPLAAAGV